MKFFEYADDTGGLIKRAKAEGREICRDDVYGIIMQNSDTAGTFAVRHALWERSWVAAGRPYYDLYPALIEPFANLNLEMPPTSIKPPGGFKNLLVRFPDHPDNKTARCMWMAWQPTKWSNAVNVPTGRDGLGEPYLVVGADFGERDSHGFQVTSVYAPPPDDSKTIQEWLDTLAYREDIVGPITTGIYPSGQTALFKMVRIAVCLCLLGNDPDYVVPQLLNKDIPKVHPNTTPERLQELVARAKANGKFGFSVGAKLEGIPHTRRPHPALYWCGVGRKVGKIVFRKGAIVNRKKATTMPTGFKGAGNE